MIKKSHIYILVSYKVKECRIVNVYATKELAEAANSKSYYKNTNGLKNAPGKNDLTLHVLRFTVVETVKVGQPVKSTGSRTIKAAPKSGDVSGTSIKKAVKTVSSSRRKK